jgi:hypothetical protein
MTPRTAGRVAWALAAAAAGFAVAGCVVAGLDGRGPVDLIEAHLGIGLAVALAFPPVGALIAARDPGNRLWQVLSLAGVTLGLFVLSDVVTVATGAEGRVGVAASWLASWINHVGIWASTTLPFLLFPDGRVPSRRWRPLAVWAATLTVLAPATIAVLAWPLRGPALDASVTGVYPEPVGAAWYASFGLALLTSIPCVAACLVRLRRARGQARQQIKWFVYLAVATIPLSFFGFVPGLIGPLLEITQYLALLAGIAIGIFRHRLWDIDRLINRTLVYGLLTAVLAAVYALGVLVVGHAVGTSGETPGLVVAATTLAVAAVFQPLRRTIQHAVDRRFNRRHYDAARTIDQFAGRLRQQVDLATVARDLVGVADATVEPVTVSLWLRPGGPA